MANFGLSRPIIARFDAEKGTYSDVMKCGRAVNTSVTPNYNEAHLNADNMQVDEIVEFKNATVELGVDTIPVKAGEIMLGHKIGEDGAETSNTEDSGEYVGYGFITAERVNENTQYRACFLPKVKFREGAESYQTKGDSIQFSTPTLSGVALGNDKKDWRVKSPYLRTEKECDDWIMSQMGLGEKEPVPPAPEETEEDIV